MAAMQLQPVPKLSRWLLISPGFRQFRSRPEQPRPDCRLASRSSAGAGAMAYSSRSLISSRRRTRGRVMPQLGSQPMADPKARLAHELAATVTERDTAMSFGNDFPAAASTPFVLGLAEVASHEAVRSTLSPGEITVGIRALIDHTAPSRVGATLVARSRLVRRSGRRLYFDIAVEDDGAVVARVKHQRAIVDAERMNRRLSDR